MRQKKRKLACCAAMALTAAALSGCFSRTPAKEAAASAAADGMLTVGILDGNDAYASSNGNEFAGIEPDILNSLAEILEVDIEYRRAGDIHELMSLLEDGAVDIAAGRLTRMEAYKDSFLQSRNYGRSGIYLVTKKNRYVDNLAGYSNGTLGISWQIPGYESLNIPYIGELEREEYSDLSKLPEDIEGDVIIAGICTEREAVELLKSGAGIQAAEMRGGPRLEAVFYLAPGQEELTGNLNYAINTFLDRQAQEE